MDAKRLLEIHLNQRGAQTALVDSLGRPISWSQFGDWVWAKAGELKREDLSKPIVYRSKNTIGDVVMAIAIACVGGIDAPLDNRLPGLEFDRRMKLLQSNSHEVAIAPSLGRQHQDSIERPRTSPEGSAAMPKSLSPHGGLDDGANNNQGLTPLAKCCRAFGTSILWTSGTTSRPMGVIQSHEAWLINAAAKLKSVSQSPDDVRLTILPLSHAYARTCDLGTWLISGCTLAVDLGMKGLLRQASLIRPTLMNVVPSIAYDLLKREVPGLDRLRWLGVGGAALSNEAFDAWRKRGVTVIQGYGLTETGPVIASATPENAKAGLVGDFVDGWKHEIRDGALWVRGASLMQGYWQDHEATHDRIDAKGWLNTNDQVEVDPKTGQLRILGRCDDVIVLDNAVKIHPALFEQAATQVVGVRHAMLILRDQLELWIDGETAAEGSLRNLLLRYPWGHSTEIRFFDHPLTIEAGELTSKLTIRRNEIAERL